MGVLSCRFPSRVSLTVILFAVFVVACSRNATPQPGAPAIDTSSPTAVADGFIKAAMSGDLKTVGQYFRPDAQPGSWENVFPRDKLHAGLKGRTELVRCKGVQFDAVERIAAARASVTVTFSSQCLKGYVFKPGEQVKLGDTARVAVELSQADGRWWVERADAGYE